MSTAVTPSIDLWILVRGTPQVDPDDLLAAVEQQLKSEPLDYRIRLLIRESLLALQVRWGENALLDRLSASARKKAEDLLANDPGEVGFPTLGNRIRERTDAATILTFLRELGSAADQKTRLEIGGSSALTRPSHLAPISRIF